MKGKFWIWLSLLVVVSMVLAACGSTATPVEELTPTERVVSVTPSEVPSTATETPEQVASEAAAASNTPFRTPSATQTPTSTAGSTTPTYLPTLTRTATVTATFTRTPNPSITPSRTPSGTEETATYAQCSVDSIVINRHDLVRLESDPRAEVTVILAPRDDFPFWAEEDETLTIHLTRDLDGIYRPVIIVNESGEIFQGYVGETLTALSEVEPSLSKSREEVVPYTMENVFATSISVPKCGDYEVQYADIYQGVLVLTGGEMLTPYVFKWTSDEEFVFLSGPSVNE